MGAEEREQVALFSSSGADGAETREQLSRESSAVRGSERREQPKQAHHSHINRQSATRPPPQNLSCYGIVIIRDVCSQRRRKTWVYNHTPFTDSSTEPLKGSDKDKRSGSMREDVSGDLSPSISFSEKAAKHKRMSRKTAIKQRNVKKETYQVHLTFQEYQKDRARPPSSFQNQHPEKLMVFQLEKEEFV